MAYPTSQRALGRIVTLARVIRQVDPHIVHVNDFAPEAVIAAIIARAPHVIVTYHTPELRVRSNWRGIMLRSFARRGVRRWIFSSDMDRCTAILRRGIPPAKAAVVPFGIDPEVFSPDRTRPAHEVREELGIAPEMLVVGTVGRLSPQKGHEVLVEAARLVLSAVNTPLIFVVVGDGESRSALERLIARDGLESSFRLLGARADIADLLGCFDVFVMSSWFEGLCLAVLEAMAMARPVVATRVGGIPSSVVPGETGVLVPPGDAEALAAAVTALLRNPQRARTLGAAGRKRVLERFTVNRMVEGVSRLYDKVLQGDGRQGEGPPYLHDHTVLQGEVRKSRRRIG